MPCGGGGGGDDADRFGSGSPVSDPF